MWMSSSSLLTHVSADSRCCESMQLPCFSSCGKMIRGVAMFIKECLGVYYGIDPHGGQASDQT